MHYLNKLENSSVLQLCNCCHSPISVEVFLKFEEDVILSTANIEKKGFFETGSTVFEIRLAVLVEIDVLSLSVEGIAHWSQ